MQWLVAGLGNPGREHSRDRHNVGFAVVHRLRERWSLPAARERYRGLIAEGRIAPGGEGPQPGARRPRVALLCPMTYMNDVGRSIGPARGALRVELARVVVVHDEIDLPFGEVRAKLGGGLAGHNGLKSAAQALGGPGFRRVRVGVGRPESSDPDVVSQYVLGRFCEPDEQVRELIESACDAVEAIVLSEA